MVLSQWQFDPHGYRPILETLLVVLLAFGGEALVCHQTSSSAQDALQPTAHSFPAHSAMARYSFLLRGKRDRFSLFLIYGFLGRLGVFIPE